MFSPEANFFDEGGHSILAQQLFFLIKKEWRDIDLPVGVIFKSQSLGALAAEIERAQDPIGLRLDAMPLLGDGTAEDEAYAADARDLVRQLPATITRANKIWDYESTPTVFLTGATGFLGSYILHELLTGPTRARVIALVRAKNPAEGLAKLERSARSYGLWSQQWVSSSQLEVVVGDLAQSRLAINRTIWDRLATEVDVVIHNGAAVNWMLPYSSLRAANVLSTLACIQLCVTEKPKRFTFVSSTSTLDSDYYVELGCSIPETDDLEGSSKGLNTGYGQTKWASEFIAREAGRRGLVGAIVRPGYITGDPASGCSVTDDFLIRLWKGSLQVGARPDITNTINAVPVSQASRITVAATFHLPATFASSFGAVQVTSRQRLTFNQWIGAMETYGYRLPKVAYRDWSERVQRYVADAANEEHALLPLFHFVVGDLPANTVAPDLNDTNAGKVLRQYNKQAGGDATANPLARNDLDEHTLGTYLAFLVAIGFLPQPQDKAARALPRLEGEMTKTLVLDRVGGRSAKVTS